ncbi:MAG TPA: NAD(P)-dependent oxidoreductase [Acidobacteriaceae bacterium]|nr:NAD(P)-dependent oxidoreductase [Acidobacteriaceae bacterium]
MRIAFLGLGKMGSAAVRYLIGAGHGLTVWNRTRADAEPLAKLGAKVAETPAAAVAGAEVVMSMVFDDAALEEVLFKGGALKGMMPGAVHVCLSTISVALSDRLTVLHKAEKLRFVGAPVFGRPEVAEAGKLFTVVAGEAKAVETVKPLLETFSREMKVVGEKASAAHSVKLGGNFMIAAMIASLSEGLAYAEALGVDPKLFFETVNAALFRSPFYEAYAKVMLDPPVQPGATIALGEKDVRLFREAAQGAKVRTPLADELIARLDYAIEEGMKDADWPVAYYQLARDQKEIA